MTTTITVPKIIAGLGLGILAYVIISQNSPNIPKVNDGYIDEGTNTIINEPLAIANTIHEAMRGNDWDETDKQEIIFSTLGGLNTVQFGQVVKAFGLRPYNPTTKNDLSFIVLHTLKKYGLKTWLKNEISWSMYLQLKNKFSKYL